MKSVLKCVLCLYALALMALPATAASPGPVVVGSINPVTNQVTIFEDLLAKTFLDGTPIQHFHGRFDDAMKQYLMVRSGRSPSGNCQTDAFRLVRITNNRLAIAPDGFTRIPWNGLGHVHTLAHCISDICTGWCRVVGDETTPFDLTDYYCPCQHGVGDCEPTLGQLYKHEDIVYQGPEGPL